LDDHHFDGFDQSDCHPASLEPYFSHCIGTDTHCIGTDNGCDVLTTDGQPDLPLTLKSVTRPNKLVFVRRSVEPAAIPSGSLLSRLEGIEFMNHDHIG
jgi:hypothetical protein